MCDEANSGITDDIDAVCDEGADAVADLICDDADVTSEVIAGIDAIAADDVDAICDEAAVDSDVAGAVDGVDGADDEVTTLTTIAPVPTTAAAATTVATAEVQAAVQTADAPQLAVTGPGRSLGISLIASGLVILGAALILQSKDPEELFA